MAQLTATVNAPEGLHARPAALFAQAVKETGAKVSISCEDKGPVDAASTLSLMTLGASQGKTVELSCEEDGAEGILAQLKELLENPAA